VYTQSISKPGFEISENRIRIILPVTKINLVDKNIISKTGSGATLTYKLK